MEKKMLLFEMPVNGEILPLSEVNDILFNRKIMGEGVAVVPNDNYIASPIDGTIKYVSDKNYSVVVVTEEGVEVLIHFGLDTQRLDGRGIGTYIKVGDKVKKGTKIIFFDSSYVSKRSTLTTPIVITNPKVVIEDPEKDIDIYYKNKKEGQVVMKVNVIVPPTATP